MAKLTESAFRRAVQALQVSEQTVEIARGVLLDGKPQAEFAKALGLTRGAVSQAVSRVRRAAEEYDMPEGFEKVAAVLPSHQAFIVRKWAAEAASRMGNAKAPTPEQSSKTRKARKAREP